MKKLALAALTPALAIAATLALASPAQARDIGPTPCDGGVASTSGWEYFDVISFGLKCSNAERLAENYTYTFGTEGVTEPPGHWDRCREKNLDGPVVKVVCKRERRNIPLKVKWKMGPAAAPEGTRPAAGRDVIRQCGDGTIEGSGFYNLVAYNTACRVASKAATAFVLDGYPTPNGWSCRSHQIGSELHKGKCTRTKRGVLQTIKFLFGS